MRGIVCAAAVAFLGMAVTNARSQTFITVTVTAADAALAGQPLNLDGKLVGIVGDTIPLPKNTSQLSVHLPQGFYASLSLRLAGTALQASAPSGDDCIVSTSWRISDAPPPTISGVPPRVTLEIPPLSIIETGACSTQPSSLSCTETAAQVEVKSVPEIHASVWVGGKDAHTTTPGIVSYPYCVGMSPRMDFVLRKGGYGNCDVDIRADGRTVRTRFSVLCCQSPSSPYA